MTDAGCKAVVEACHALDRVWVSERVADYLERSVPLIAQRLPGDLAEVAALCRHAMEVIGEAAESVFLAGTPGGWVTRRDTHRVARALAEVLAVLTLIAGEPFEAFGRVWRA